jgi:CheY-like chemotaxis protein
MALDTPGYVTSVTVGQKALSPQCWLHEFSSSLSHSDRAAVMRRIFLKEPSTSVQGTIMVRDTSSAGPSATGQLSATILLVDDNAPWRSRVRSILSGQLGLQVIDEASDGLGAIRKAAELKPDLILLNIGLPTVHGLEAAKWISEAAPTTKILFLTQDNQPDLVRAALSNGARGYVLKSDAINELLPAIEAVLAGRRFVSLSVKK